MASQNFSSKKAQLQYLLQDLPLTINWWSQIDSTSLQAKRFCQNRQYQHPVLFISDQQTAAYGKKERRFISELGGVYLSLLIKIPQLTPQNQGLLTTGIAWQLYQVIKEQFQITTEIKWVNDLLLNKKKVAGILVEKPTTNLAIIGIGCNLYQQDLMDELPSGTNLLENLPTDEQVCQFINQLVHHLFSLTQTFDNGEFLPDYQTHLGLLNKEITVQLGHQIITGKAIALNSQANLILKTNQGLKTIGAGEVTKIRY